MFEPELLPPLPVTLEEAHREIRYLQQRIYVERQMLATNVAAREKDRRAAKGNIRILADAIAEAKVYLNKAIVAKTAPTARNYAAIALEMLQS